MVNSNTFNDVFFTLSS